MSNHREAVHINERVILTTIGKKVVVRPQVKEGTLVDGADDLAVCLSKEGAEAWNNGEDMNLGHALFWYNRTHIVKGIVF